MRKSRASLVNGSGVLIAVVGMSAAAAYGCNDTTDEGTPGRDGGTDARGSADGSVRDGGGGGGADAGRDGSVVADGGAESGLPGSSGPTTGAQQFLAPAGTDVAEGKRVFRFETFGNEGFWTRVLQLPQGMKGKRFTPAMALAAGVSVDANAIPAALKTKLAAELVDAGASPDLTKLPSFNDPAVLEALVEANAVIGLSARNVTTLNGTLDINPTDVYAGESIGLSCAFCHSITDGSVYASPSGGSIGARVDGPTNHNLQVGKSLALAANSRAMYPTLALDLVANNHGSVSRKGPKSATNPLISAAATEEEVDAYLNDDVLYPVGMFDDATDGNGAPMHITPFFRTDLAAPWGSEGSIHFLQNFNNLVYSALFDLTDFIGSRVPATGSLSLDGGAPLTGAQQFEYDRGGPAGLEIVTKYKAIIEGMGILPYSPSNPNGYPYVGRSTRDPAEVATGLAAGAKVEASPIGIQVSQVKLKNLTAYLNGLRPPAGLKTDVATIARGRVVFRQQCTSCHNDDQSKFVPENIVPFSPKVELFAAAPSRPDLFPSWDGVKAADRPGPPAAGLVPVRNYSGTFDDKFIIIEASNQGQPRGDALPLLMDLARKPTFLHDDSVRDATPALALAKLLDPSRGAAVPHPFFVADAMDRAAVVFFLRSLDDTPLP